MPVNEIPVWRHAPFIRLLIPFITGIMVQHYCGFPVAHYWIGVIGAILLLLCVQVFRSSFHYRYYWINGAAINLLVMSMGCLLCFYQNITHRADWFGHHYGGKQQIVLTLDEPLSERNNTYKTTATVKCLLSASQCKTTVGKLVIYFQKNSCTVKLKPGFDILVRKTPERIAPSGNPGAFDYSNYLQRQGIYHQLYLTPAEVIVIREGTAPYLQRYIHKTTNQILQILRQYITGKKESGLAEALLIGYKDDLDKTLLQSYANTGVVHVIAISGLHLGLIYWLLATMLKPVGKSRRSRMVKSVLIITGLWIFSLLAGASPSVLRSALMFSFIVIGETAGRKTSIYNSLAASAFILLSYNPLWLWDAGFQLSYIAVLSLVIFMKPVYDCIFIRNRLLDVIWNLSAVTLAAQVLTFPVCIYLFHQFPTYFLLTNLPAIPLSGIILLGEILLCAVSSLPVIAGVCGEIIRWLINLMNDFIQHMEGLPLGVIKDLQLSFPSLLLLYLAITALTVWLFHQMKSALFAGLILLLLVAVEKVIASWKMANQQKLVVYNLKGKAIDIINGKESFLFTDGALVKDETIQRYIFSPSKVTLGIHKRTIITTPVTTSFHIGIKKIAIAGKPFKNIKPGARVHLLVVTGKSAALPAQVFSSIQSELVILDGSLGYTISKEWKRYCAANNIVYWDVTEKGAFIINLN